MFPIVNCPTNWPSTSMTIGNHVALTRLVLQRRPQRRRSRCDGGIPTSRVPRLPRLKMIVILGPEPTPCSPVAQANRPQGDVAGPRPDRSEFRRPPRVNGVSRQVSCHGRSAGGEKRNIDRITGIDFKRVRTHHHEQWLPQRREQIRRRVVTAGERLDDELARGLVAKQLRAMKPSAIGTDDIGPPSALSRVDGSPAGAPVLHGSSGERSPRR